MEFWIFGLKSSQTGAKYQIKTKKTFAAAKVFFLSILGVADVLGLCGIKGQIADRGNQAVNAKGNGG